jgi:protease PrsW
MAIRVVCPQCTKVLQAPDNAAGKRARCPGCKGIVIVPAAQRPQPPAKPLQQPSLRAVERPAANVAKPTASTTERDDEYRIADAPAPPTPAAAPQPRQAAAPQPRQAAPRQATAPSPASAQPLAPLLAAAPQALAGRPALAAARRVPAARHAEAAPGSTLRDYAYVLFAIALLPLAWSIMAGNDDIQARVQRTIEANPEVFQEIDEQGGKDQDATAFFSRLPNERFEGAHLARSSWMHWLYALVAAAAFLGLILLSFHRGQVNPLHILLIGLCTATFGIMFLFLVQWIAVATQGVWIRGNWIVMLIFYFVKFVGFSYSAASDPENGFLLSFVGFTCGVGLCEEFTKAMPIIVRARNDQGLSWRAACMWGLASGVGFGVAEGIMYSSRHYNGIATGDAYLVRFVSCVALHAIWAAAVALLIWHNQDKFYAETEWSDFLLAVLMVQGVPMVLHGLYDTMLKREMEAAALAVAVASFVWLAFLVEYTRRQQEDEPAPNRRTAPAG